MTYWAAWSANVGEAAAPLLDFLEGLAAAGAKTASEWYGAPGWVAHGYTDLWRDARALGENKWALCATCGAWAALALSEASEHAPGDASKLAAAARVLGGALDFFEGYLLPVAAGDAGKLGLPSAPALLSGPSTSPENSYRLNGSAANLRGASKARDDWGFVALSPALDVAVLHRLATAYGELCARGAACAAATEAFAARLLLSLPHGGRPVADAEGMLREYPVAVGGRAAAAPDEAHRHFSGLFALYPGRQLSPLDDADGAAAAAARTLDRKLAAGGGHTGRSRRPTIFERFGVGEIVTVVRGRLVARVGREPGGADARRRGRGAVARRARRGLLLRQPPRDAPAPPARAQAQGRGLRHALRCVWNGPVRQNFELSGSIRLIFGRVVCSRRVLHERNRRIRSY